MSKKPKRTLVQIRAEKQALRESINDGNSVLKTLLGVTPHRFLKSASYNEVIEYKEFAAKCSAMGLHPKDSTNLLIKKLANLKVMILKIQKYVK